MSAGSRCFACEMNRHLIEVVPIADGYEMQTLKCSRCGSTMKLVTATSKGLDRTA